MSSLQHTPSEKNRYQEPRYGKIYAASIACGATGVKAICFGLEEALMVRPASEMERGEMKRLAQKEPKAMK